MQGNLARSNTTQADLNSNLDESPINVMASRSKTDSGHPNVIIRRAQTRFASLDENYDSHVPDLKFKTYSARASYAGPLAPLESSVPPVKKQTSLWSLTSAAGSSNPIHQSHFHIGHVRGHTHFNGSPITIVANGEPMKASQSWLRRDFTAHDEFARSVAERVNSQSHPVHTPCEKSRVSSEISESETDATMSSPASDRVGSYCVTNNKLNVVTKL